MAPGLQIVTLHSASEHGQLCVKCRALFFRPEASRPSQDNQFYIVLSFSSAEAIYNGYLPFIIVIFNPQRGPTTLFEHTQEMLRL